MSHRDSPYASIRVTCSSYTLGSYAAMSEHIQISPGDTLQDYLCSGSMLQLSDVVIVLKAGEHRIPTGPFCSVFNVSNVLITGSSSGDTIVRCQGERGFGFTLVQNVTIERTTFVGCGGENADFGDKLSVALAFQSSLNVSVRHCTFQNSYASSTVHILSSGMVSISNCVFQNNTAENGGSILVEESTSTTIKDCTFQDNNVARYVIFALYSDSFNVVGCTFQDVWASNWVVNLYEVKGNIYITSCEFQAANSPSVIHVYSSVVTNGTTAYITKCVFRDNNAALHVIHLQEFDSVNISNCIFQSSFRSIGVYNSKYVVVENCIFQDAISDLALDDSDIIKLRYVTGSTHITNCQFHANLYASSVIEQIFQNSTETVTYITGCVFQDSIVTAGIIDILAAVLTDDIYIANCTFWNNTVSYHGGIITVADLVGFNSNFSVTDCIFQHNSVVGVGVIYIWLN